MQFLSNWTINVTKIPTYEDFVENIDFNLANIILEEKDKSIATESLAYFNNLVTCIDKNKNELKVKYSPRKGGLGRRYPDCPAKGYIFRWASRSEIREILFGTNNCFSQDKEHNLLLSTLARL